MSARTRTIMLVVGVLSIGASLFAADDPFIGLWKLNIAKSTFHAGQPKDLNHYIKVEPMQGGAKVTVGNMDATGNVTGHVRPETYEDQPHPLSTIPECCDAISGKRIDASTVEVDNWRNGQIRERIVRVLSKDRKTMTLKFKKGTAAAGDPYDDIRVYERQ